MLTKFVSSLFLAALALADSETISLMILRSGTAYQYASVNVDAAGLFNIGSSGKEIDGVITDDGRFKLSDGSFVVVNSDGTITTGTDGSSPFSIDTPYLEYQGSSGFYIDDSTGNVLFGSGSTNPVSVAATGAKGYASSFSPGSSVSSSGASSSSSSSAAESSATAQNVTNSSSSTESSAKPTVATFDNGATALSGTGAFVAFAAAALLI